MNESGAQRRLRPTSFIVDALLAAVVLVATIVGYLVPGGVSRSRLTLGVALLALQAVPLAWRRVAPLQVLAVTSGAYVFYGALDERFASPWFAPIMLYTVAAYTPARQALTAGALGAAAVMGVTGLEIADDRASYTDLGSLAAVMAIAWIVGWRIRRSRVHQAELAGRAARLEREREESAKAAVRDERARIARELHDVVAHNVGIIVVQASGAKRVIDQRPEEARSALGSIEQAGRGALTELRRLLGVMREDDRGAALEPLPGVDALPAVLEQVRAAGLPVEMHVEGTVRPLPSSVDLSAHRIVQESLTNVLKHAGPARATVCLRYTADAIEVEIADDGRGAAAPSGDGRGRGLFGMRERAALFDGAFEAGPRPEGGFVVRARLPYGGEPS